MTRRVDGVIDQNADQKTMKRIEKGRKKLDLSEATLNTPSNRSAVAVICKRKDRSENLFYETMHTRHTKSI